MYLGQFAEVSCAAFCERMRREGLTGLEGAAQETTEGVRHAEKSLSATLRPTLERLNEAERLTLTLAALLPADHVTLPWIRVVAAEEFAQLGKDAKPGYPDPWQGVIRRLYSLRVLQATAEPNEAHMHRLLQEVIRREVAPAALEAWERRLFEHIKARRSFCGRAGCATITVGNLAHLQHACGSGWNGRPMRGLNWLMRWLARFIALADSPKPSR